MVDLVGREIRDVKRIVIPNQSGGYEVYTVGDDLFFGSHLEITRISEFEKTGQNAMVSWFRVYTTIGPVKEINAAFVESVDL